jgi:hypothetical protein
MPARTRTRLSYRPMRASSSYEETTIESGGFRDTMFAMVHSSPRAYACPEQRRGAGPQQDRGARSE